MARPDHSRDRPESVRATWRDGVVLVCRECDGAKGLDPEQARQALKHEAKAALGRRSVVVVETSCLDVCPKKGVTVAGIGADGAWDRAVVVRSAAACQRLMVDLAEARDDRSNLGVASQIDQPDNQDGRDARTGPTMTGPPTPTTP